MNVIMVKQTKQMWIQIEKVLIKELTEPIDGSNLKMNEIRYFHMPCLQYRTLNNIIDSNESEKNVEISQRLHLDKNTPEITIKVRLFCMQ